MALGIQVAETIDATYGSDATTAALTTTTGSTFVVVACKYGAAGATSVTDSKSNSYTQIGTDYTNGATINVWKCENGTGGASHTATATAASSDWWWVAFIEISGAAAASQDQLVDFTNDTSSPFTSGTTGTTAQANELILAALYSDNYSGADSWTWGNSFTELATGIEFGRYGNMAVGYRIVSSTGTYQSSVTTTGSPSNVTTLIVTFKEAGGGGPTYTDRGSMRGVMRGAFRGM